MRYRLMELNRRLKNPEYAQNSWSQEGFPEPEAPGPQQPVAKGGGAPGAPGAGALASFLAPQEGDFDPSKLESLEGEPTPTAVGQQKPMDMLAEKLKLRRKPAEQESQRMRGELVYG